MRAVSQNLLSENPIPGLFHIKHTQEPLNRRLPAGIDAPALP